MHGGGFHVLRGEENHGHPLDRRIPRVSYSTTAVPGSTIVSLELFFCFVFSVPKGQKQNVRWKNDGEICSISRRPINAENLFFVFVLFFFVPHPIFAPVFSPHTINSISSDPGSLITRGGIVNRTFNTHQHLDIFTTNIWSYF